MRNQIQFLNTSIETSGGEILEGFPLQTDNGVSGSKCDSSICDRSRNFPGKDSGTLREKRERERKENRV